MNNLPITNIDKWYNCSLNEGIGLRYSQYFFLSTGNPKKIVHGYLTNKTISIMEGITITYEGNYFNLPVEQEGDEPNSAKRVYLLLKPSIPKL